MLIDSTLDELSTQKFPSLLVLVDGPGQGNPSLLAAGQLAALLAHVGHVPLGQGFEVIAQGACVRDLQRQHDSSRCYLFQGLKFILIMVKYVVPILQTIMHYNQMASLSP